MLNYRGGQILARFPGPVTVRPVLTLSGGLLIIGSMLFAMACLWAAWRGWHLKDSDSSTWGLGLCAGLFAFFSMGSAVMLRTNSMTLDREGFEIITGTVFGIRKGHWPWREVSEFEPMRQHLRRGSCAVAFDDARKGGGTFAGVNRSLGFRNSTLLEEYGLGDDQLAKLLNHWRELAIAKTTASRPVHGRRDHNLPVVRRAR